MKSTYKAFLRKLVSASATVLPVLAVTFAAAPCIFKLYEPKLPAQLMPPEE